MNAIDLNVDIGEGFPYDEALMEFATSVNICCGAHAGSIHLTEQTIARARSHGLRIGAHPGFPDRASMGRTNPTSDEQRDLWLRSLIEQAEAFRQLGSPSYIKPHGAWYNLLTSDEANSFRRPLDVMLERCHARPMLLAGFDLGYENAIREGFADRSTLPDGRLKPRTEPGAVLIDPELVRAQVLRMAPRVDSICLHGDGDHCLEFAALVTMTLVDAGFKVKAC